MKRKDTLKARGIHRHKQMVTVLGMKYKDRNDMNHNHSRKDSFWKRIKGIYWLKYTVAAVWAAFVFLPDAGIAYGAAKAGGGAGGASEAGKESVQGVPSDTEEAEKYSEYHRRFGKVEYQSDIADCGFCVMEDQIFPIEMAGYGDAFFVPAMDEDYDRLLLFFVAADGEILYRTDQLETNGQNRGRMEQPNKGISAVSFQDVNGDGRMDIVLITSCASKEGSYAGKTYKVGDVLFQNEEGTKFYRDYRISDKINRFSMNKSIDLIASFVRDGNSTEFLYTAATLDELQRAGLEIISEQCYFRNFEKLGRLQVVPGVYSIAEYGVFMIYLVNEQGYIVSSLQPMGEYDNLYALKGISCRDIDGDGMKDIVVLARYSYEGSGHELIVKSDYAVYYQRTGGFSADTEIKGSYHCGDEDTMEEVVEKARAYWGWKSEK